MGCNLPRAKSHTKLDRQWQLHDLHSCRSLSRTALLLSHLTSFKLCEEQAAPAEPCKQLDRQRQLHDLHTCRPSCKQGCCCCPIRQKSSCIRRKLAPAWPCRQLDRQRQLHTPHGCCSLHDAVDQCCNRPEVTGADIKQQLVMYLQAQERQLWYRCIRHCLGLG